MEILQLELKKIITAPAIWAFVILCAIFNLFVFFGDGTYAPETAEPPNVFAGYQTESIAETYIRVLNFDGRIAAATRKKYAALQPVIEQKAQGGDSLGQYTYWQHRSIFADTLKAVLYEGGILAALIMLLALGYENASRTEQCIYAAKTGRAIVWHKLAAALLAAQGCYAIIALTSIITIYSSYRDIWRENVSSAANFIQDYYAGSRPFATWHSFTVGGYLWAVVGIAAGIVVCFSLLAFAVGTASRNSYAGFMVLFMIVVSCVFIPWVMPNNNYLAFAFTYTPVLLSMKLPLWFTDGGADVLGRNFETWGLVISLAALSAIAFFAVCKLKRRDII
ncbi:MAG: hypothetical protein LBI54_03700 [Lachnospiraceae bacterium]|jgi:ABC-type transport system involved in multi-copper enzyme maturation permease subunit|nr:hypothetical protein [Lachnospiraceae bacterium]